MQGCVDKRFVFEEETRVQVARRIMKFCSGSDKALRNQAQNINNLDM